MPPEVKTAMDYRQEFVLLATQEGANVRNLCRRYHYAPATAYKWITRYRTGGLTALADHSRRPATSPRRTDPALETQVLALRDEHPTWGGRKLHHWLRHHECAAPPAPSTITAILRRHDRLDETQVITSAFTRFEHPAPNDLWQLDFMGHRPLAQGRVHPLTLLDDHSRFGLALVACDNQRRTTVQAELTACFARYGLPWTLLMDNGPPWGTSGGSGLTGFEAWLIQLGIRVVHGRAYHPQTQGKVERWHGTIGHDLFRARPFADLAQAQQAFDTFRTGYNTERPHDALDGEVPVSRYQPSARVFPATLPEITYDVDETVHVVRAKGEITVDHRRVFISEGLAGLPVGVRPTTTDGIYRVRFCQRELPRIDCRESAS